MMWGKSFKTIVYSNTLLSTRRRIAEMDPVDDVVVSCGIAVHRLILECALNKGVQKWWTSVIWLIDET